jgi:effector-binding domain-containing protein
MAYSALDYWLEKNDKAAGGLPFEVYLNDPVTVQDPYDLRTDIYQLLIDIPHSTH